MSYTVTDIENKLRSTNNETVYKYYYKSKYKRGEEFINFKADDLKGEIDSVCKELINLGIDKITVTDYSDDILKEFKKYGFEKLEQTKIKTGSFIWINELGYEDDEYENALILKRDL